MTNSTYTKGKVKAVFFDVAQTLLYKPDLFNKISGVLQAHGYIVDKQNLVATHKLLSEVVTFPDKTSRTFYQGFNKELLYLLGIVASQKILDDIFEACSYLPWQGFEDTTVLKLIQQPMGIISNWDKTLPEKLAGFFDAKFEWILGSENEGIKKPNPLFYSKIPVVTKLHPAEILYVGDSIKLDIEPAMNLGMNALLIDRFNVYPGSNLKRLKNLNEIIEYI